MTYFLAFDYWTTKENKFWNGIIDEDLSKISLQQICRDIINRMNHEEHEETWVIKVLSFNNVDIKSS